ncbi:sensor histidine kinase [Leisingera thetidis]|uniref:sensor histidine kinase n=1 Tax=Leisingera thetidis TaxID=2930199 RepID=UPI0021F7FC50|nr:PAS domain-containing sensor histidine kinase [Leisingera thetidis]
MKLKTKVALTVFCVMGFFLTLFFTVDYLNAKQRVQKLVTGQILSNDEIYSHYAREVFAGLEKDLNAFSSFPAIAAIIRSYNSGSQVDPLSGLSLEQSREQLEKVFASLITNRTGYTQLRLLLNDGNWQEFVRVNARDGTAEIVPPHALQSKDGEPYLKNIAERAGSKGFYYSRLTRNREHGQVSGPPTIRIVHPVLDADGAVFGAVVVNTSAEVLLTHARPDIASHYTVYLVTNQQADPDGSAAEPAFLFHSEPERTTLLPQDVMAAPEGVLQRFGDAGDAFFIYPVRGLPDSLPLRIRMVTLVDLDGLLSPAVQELKLKVLGAGVLIPFATLVGYFATARLLRPLEHLLAEVRTKANSMQPLENSYAGTGEIQDLAASFAIVITQLQRQRNRLDAILENAAEGVMAVDESGLIEEANPAVQEIFGYSAEELLGKPLVQLMRDKDACAHMSYIRNADLGGRSKTMSETREIWGVRKDGSLVPLDISVSQAHYLGERHFIGVLKDVSLRKQAEEQRQALIEALRRSNSELDQFAYIVSHDLKAPLRVIQNASNWLQEDLEDTLTQDTRESLELLRNRAMRMEKLLDDLLRHSRIGRVSTSEATGTGAEIQDEILALLEIPNGMQVHFSSRFKDLNFRKLPLQTVLLNLIANGIKHHDKSEGNIWVDVSEHEASYRFAVCDDGPGIAEQFHSRIFDIFQTLKPKDHTEGSGMGLAIVRKHIEVIGGEISVHSDGSCGTCFRFTWPRAPLKKELAA